MYTHIKVDDIINVIGQKHKKKFDLYKWLLNSLASLRVINTDFTSINKTEPYYDKIECTTSVSLHSISRCDLFINKNVVMSSFVFPTVTQQHSLQSKQKSKNKLICPHVNRVSIYVKAYAEFFYGKFRKNKSKFAKFENEC